MTGRARFGDFLHAAHHALDGSGSGPAPARGDVEEVSRSLLRVITVVGRYLHDTAIPTSDPPGRTPRSLGAWDRARLQAGEALTNAAGYLLQPGTPRPGWPAVPSASPLARRLDDVATSLALGRDLLHTHLTPGPPGSWAHRSAWAPVITCEPLNRALLAELGPLAGRAAHHGANVALTPLPGTTPNANGRRRLTAACQWLWALNASVQAARRAEPVPAADTELLAAIPVNTLPARPVLADTETVAGLCEAVIATAERLRHLAWQPRGQPPGLPSLSVTSWRQAAETSTVTNHHCALLARTLAACTSHGADPARADLAAAAHAAHQARGSWYQAARALRQVTTATRGHLSPAAAEASELARWTGRLAYADPTWTLAAGPHHPTRPPADQAPRPDDVPHVAAAVYHACEALAQHAETEHRQLRAAAHTGQILVPTRTLPDDHDIPRPYAPAPPGRTDLLLARYHHASQASHQAATAAGRAAQATGAPSRVLATARAATHTTHSPSPHADRGDRAALDGQEPAPDLPGPLQRTLLALGVTSPALLARGAGLDHASQRLLIDAADHLPPTRPPAATLNNTAAALLNHVLASGDPAAAQLLCQTGPPDREDPQPEP